MLYERVRSTNNIIVRRKNPNSVKSKFHSILGFVGGFVVVLRTLENR